MKNMRKKFVYSGIALLATMAVAHGEAHMKHSEEKIEQHVSDLMEQMTLEEKIIQMNAFFPNANARLGIPHMSTGEALHGMTVGGATCFPQAIGLGATWDDGLINEMGKVIAKEGRAAGIHHVFSPMLGLARDPRWGRVEESYSEDPWLVSRMGVAFINGVQGTGDDRFGSDNMVCAPKHFAADGESLRGSNAEMVELSETTLRETHLRPFEDAVKEAHAGSLMPAHHSLNRIPCHANKWLLDDVLRKEWGFKGFIVSDNIDIIKLYRLDETEGHYFASSAQEAARMALEAGVDTELAMGAPWDHERCTYGGNLVNAVKTGAIPEALINRSVRRILRAKYQLGLFDVPELCAVDRAKGVELPEVDTSVADPWAKAIREGKTIGFKRIISPNWDKVRKDKAHEALSLKMSQKCIVLLKNENNLLPLDKNKISNIAVIGPNADANERGNYSGWPRYFVTVLDGIRAHVGKDVKVRYAKGCNILASKDDNIPEAVKLAEQSDLSIVVVGTSHKTMGENLDRSVIELTGAQEELVKAVHATGKPVVVVLINGGAVAIPWIKENIPAIVEGWYAGQDTGTAMAQVLFGEVNPGGKLPVTFPYSTGMVPCYYNSMPPGGPQKYNEGKFRVCFPFGYGLSYTTFQFGEPALDKTTITPKQSAQLTITVTNTGDRAGDEVVQMYVMRKAAARVRPLKELRGFKRIHLKAGETKKVRLPVGFEQLKSWLNDEWTVEKGPYTLLVGPDSTEGQEINLQVK